METDKQNAPPRSPDTNGDGKAKETITLPTVNKPVLVVSEEGMCWVGIPLFLMPLIEVMCILDQAKGVALKFYKSQQGKVTLVKPGMVQATKDFLRRMH